VLTVDENGLTQGIETLSYIFDLSFTYADNVVRSLKLYNDTTTINVTLLGTNNNDQSSEKHKLYVTCRGAGAQHDSTRIHSVSYEWV
jgi:hypothetical protein